ncbi:MAG TPA: M23 family metallopeptidase [Rhodocyclaceae bacterium]|nr:M23 family metallopeptidase [Rhodocyclaceae bacterium]
MHIILVSDRLATAKTIVLTQRHVVMVTVALVAIVIALSSLFSYVTVRHAAEIRLPFLQQLLQATTAEENRASREFVRENINAMAVRLGEMQAQLLRLDSMGERVAGLAGIKPQDLGAIGRAKDGRGGPLIQPTSLSADELRTALDSLSHQLEVKSDALSLLETQLLDERIRKSQLPTSMPVELAWNASSYGWRADPITGETAMHTGVDFTADVGTPIKSAAAGVVVNVEKHPSYGNMVDIDHGNDLITRYAHCSTILVQPGSLVKRGQKIAEVGNTGRTTGPHLHFEVRVKGVTHNPNSFLQMAQANSSRAAHRH